MSSISAESNRMLSFINSCINDRIIEQFILGESAQHHLIKVDAARSGSSGALSISRNNIKILISLVEKGLTRKQPRAFRQCTRGHREGKTKLPTTVWHAVHCQGLPVQGHWAGLLIQPLWWHPLDRHHSKGLTWQHRNTLPEFHCWLFLHRPVLKNAVGVLADW